MLNDEKYCMCRSKGVVNALISNFLSELDNSLTIIVGNINRIIKPNLEPCARQTRVNRW